MSTVHDLLPLGYRDLWAAMDAGHPIDASALDDTEYHGVALGNPGWVEALTWKTFKKVFLRDPASGVLRGWNVAVEQNGVDGPFVDREKRGKRITYWHYGVRHAAEYRPPGGGHQQGLMIDYGLGERGLLNVQRLIRDPLVAIDAGSVELLLGYSYAALGVAALPTPTFFVLTRGAPLTYEVPLP